MQQKKTHTHNYERATCRCRRHQNVSYRRRQSREHDKIVDGSSFIFFCQKNVQKNRKAKHLVFLKLHVKNCNSITCKQDVVK